MTEVGSWGLWCQGSLVESLGKLGRELRKCIYLKLPPQEIEWGRWVQGSATLHG